MTTLIVKLDNDIKAECPIHGVSIGSWDDQSSWRIDFKSEATQSEKDDAQTIMDSFDPDSYTLDDFGNIVE